MYLHFSRGVGDDGSSSSSSDAKETAFGRLEFVEGGVGIVVALDAVLNLELGTGVEGDKN